MRHGESTWNVENKFTGWVDVPLTAKGEGEAKEAGKMLSAAGISPGLAFTSYLQRAQRTLQLAMIAAEIDVPVVSAWQLNERHYGALTGLDKAETVEKHGAEQVKIWRRSYAVPPPDVDEASEFFQGNDPKYAHVAKTNLPKAESLKMTRERVLPFWESVIKPVIKTGTTVLVSAHGNSLRAMLMELDGISEDDIPEINIPTGTPLVYDLDANLRVIPRPDAIAPLRGAYLGDAAAVAAKAAAVAAQTEKK